MWLARWIEYIMLDVVLISASDINNSFCFERYVKMLSHHGSQ